MVGESFYDIHVFGLRKATEIRVQMKKNDIFRLDEGSDVMFYYMTNQSNSSVKFTMFDKSMRTIEFDS